MEGLLTALLFVMQVVNGNPVSQECCVSKTVGDYSYTRVDTSVGFPKACLAPCAYTRDDQPGSLYCFAAGSLAVKCTGEKPEPMNYPLTVGPLGNLPDPTNFTDDAIGEINEIVIFTGASGAANIAVLGITIKYGDSPKKVHGNTEADLNQTVCTPNIPANRHFGKIKAQSSENAPKPDDNLIFQLTFIDTEGDMICSSPPTEGGSITQDQTPQDAKLKSISGSTTLLGTSQPQIASLTFNY